jgi:hypothetical protein
MENGKYNGWTNYATWRVNLEVFDGFDIEDFDDAYELSEYIKNYLTDYIIETSGEGLARDYALAFISDVNYYEIAEHLIEFNAK